MAGQQTPDAHSSPRSVSFALPVIFARGLRGLVVVFWATWEAVAVLWEATRDCEAVAPVDEGAA